MPAPGEPGDERGGVAWLDPAASASQNRALTWAIPTRETASSRDGLVGQAGVLVDHVGDHRRRTRWSPGRRARGRPARWSGRTRRPAGTRRCRRRRSRRTPPSSPRRAVLLSCGRRQRRAAVVDDRVAGGVEQREVEVELAGEVLVEHRLGDPGPLGDVVHRGGVVALGDEHLERGVEQLGARALRGIRPPRRPSSPAAVTSASLPASLPVRRSRLGGRLPAGHVHPWSG